MSDKTRGVLRDSYLNQKRLSYDKTLIPFTTIICNLTWVSIFNKFWTCCNRTWCDATSNLSAKLALNVRSLPRPTMSSNKPYMSIFLSLEERLCQDHLMFASNKASKKVRGQIHVSRRADFCKRNVWTMASFPIFCLPFLPFDCATQITFG